MRSFVFCVSVESIFFAVCARNICARVWTKLSARVQNRPTHPNAPIVRGYLCFCFLLLRCLCFVSATHVNKKKLNFATSTLRPRQHCVFVCFCCCCVCWRVYVLLFNTRRCCCRTFHVRRAAALLHSFATCRRHHQARCTLLRQHQNSGHQSSPSS